MRTLRATYFGLALVSACGTPNTNADTAASDAVSDETAAAIDGTVDAHSMDTTSMDLASMDVRSSDDGMRDVQPSDVIMNDVFTPDADARVDGGTSYDALVLADGPVAFWALAGSATGTEVDLSGHGHDGSYRGGTPALVAMPNGDMAADFDGATQYVTVPSSSAFSIPTTHALTWEAWIRPDVLQFPHESGGYVDFMGKCASYSPTCEWESRMYDVTNSQMRYSRMSAYVFNSSAGLGSAADWQPASGVVAAGHWYHVVGEYQTLTQPTGCNGPQVGGINIWVDGVAWDMAAHLQTGCMSQYGVTPVANNSPLNIGTMAMDTWFEGAIGKVAIYDRLLTPAEIARHYTAMTGQTVSGSCTNTCTL